MSDHNAQIGQIKRQMRSQKSDKILHRNTELIDFLFGTGAHGVGQSQLHQFDAIMLQHSPSVNRIGIVTIPLTDEARYTHHGVEVIFKKAALEPVVIRNRELSSMFLVQPD